MVESFQALLCRQLRGRPLTDTEKDPRRRLAIDDYFSLVLFGLFNPVVRSLRGLSAAGLRWASQQSGGFDWDFGSGALQPSTQEYDGFYRLEADNGRSFPQPKGGRTAQQGSPPLPYTSLQAALRLHPGPILRGSEVELIPCSGSRATAPYHNRLVNFGASASVAPKTAPARPARKGRRSGSRLRFEASGLTAVSFWTAPRLVPPKHWQRRTSDRGAGRRGEVRLAPGSAPPD